MSKILFVDDEPSILGIYELLGPLISEDCTVMTANCGEDALRLMQQHSFDVLVSDLVMPTMTGLELLAETAERFPATGRIVVSGCTDELTAAKCHILAHRYYGKPFNPVTLSGEIAALCKARNFAANTRIREYVGRINALPSGFATYSEITKILRSETLPTQQVSEIVEKDLALTAKVLQMVNSVSIAPARPIKSVFDAVQMIGLGAVHALVVSARIFDFCREVAGTELYQTIWKHSLDIGTRAKHLAFLENLPADDCDEAFLIGLLHDIGKVVLAASCPEYHEMWSQHRQDAETLARLEAAAFGADHAHIGAYLLRLWGVPEATVEAVRLHHSLEAAAIITFNPLLAVHAAQQLAPDRSGGRIDETIIARLELADRLPIWKEIATQGRQAIAAA